MKPTICALFLIAMGLRARAEPATASFTTTASGLQYVITQRGSGKAPASGQVVIVHYIGMLSDGAVFDSSRERKPLAFTLSRPPRPDGTGEIKRSVIAGWDEGFRLLRVWDRAVFIVPPALAYGDKARSKIPPNSILRFDVELLELKPAALADLLSEAIETVGLAAARTRFSELKTTGFGDYYVSESQLNGLGYRLMKDKLVEARAVFEWNVELFPNSGNVYDSLGEIVLKLGDRNQARRLYERALELDPKNENARKVLDALAVPPPAAK